MLQSTRSTTAAAAFFANELARLGPRCPPSAWSLAQSQRYCRLWARRSDENFTVVSWLLPRRLRQDFFNVYAFCRWADNLADELDDPDESMRLLDWWQQQLTLCYSGRPAHPVLVGLQHTLERHRMPLNPFLDLLSAFRQDQSVKRYETPAQLMDYCRRSANPVGRILLHLADACNEKNLELSDRVCSALQLTNFCQDMSRDAAMNRIYIPRTAWVQHGVSEEDLLARRVTEPLRSLLADWVRQSRDMFDVGRPLVERLPTWLSFDVDLFIRGGMAVLDAIERQDYDVWSRRPGISRLGKLGLMGRSVVMGWAVHRKRSRY